MPPVMAAGGVAAHQGARGGPSNNTAKKSTHTGSKMTVSARTQFMIEEIEEEVQTPAQRVVNSHHFAIIVNGTIVLNAVQMGLAADLSGEDWEATWNGFELFFAAFFFLEMVIKLVGLGFGYFRQDKALQPWNLFDFLIVWSSVIDILSQLVTGSDGGSLAAMLGLLRLLRLLRMMKLLRVIPQFRILFDGILSALHSMFWVGLLCLFLLYMVGVASVTLLGRKDAGFSHFEEDQEWISHHSMEDFNNYQYFGTVKRSMYSLFGICVMAELETILRPLWESSPLVCLSLLLLSFVMMFGVLNILVGMIMDNVMQTVKQMDSEADKREQQKRAALTDELADALYEIDVNHDGTITTREFKDDSQGKRVNALAHELNLPHGFTLNDVFTLVDSDQDGNLSKDEFSDGMFRIVMNDEFQRSIMAEFRIAEVKRELKDMRQCFTDQFCDLKQSLLREFSPGAKVELKKSGGAEVSAAAESTPGGDCSAELVVESGSPLCEQKTELKAMIGASQDNLQQQGLTSDIMQKLVRECERVEDLWRQAQEERLKVQAERCTVELERQHIETQAQKMRDDQEASERQMHVLRDESAKSLETLQQIAAASTPQPPDRSPNCAPPLPPDSEAMRTFRLNLAAAAQDQQTVTIPANNAVPLPRAPNSSGSTSTPRSCTDVYSSRMSCVSRDKSRGVTPRSNAVTPRPGDPASL